MNCRASASPQTGMAPARSFRGRRNGSRIGIRKRKFVTSSPPSSVTRSLRGSTDDSRTHQRHDHRAHGPTRLERGAAAVQPAGHTRRGRRIVQRLGADAGRAGNPQGRWLRRPDSLRRAAAGHAHRRGAGRMTRRLSRMAWRAWCWAARWPHHEFTPYWATGVFINPARRSRSQSPSAPA